MRILVADSNKRSLNKLDQSLKTLGHEVVLAKNSDETLKLFFKTHFDLVIIDEELKSMSWFECAKKLHETVSTDFIPIIIIITSYTDEVIAIGIDAGIHEYIIKPFNTMTLISKIKSIQLISDLQKKLHESSRQLNLLSTKDLIKGIHNREEFNHAIKDKIEEARTCNKKLALLIINIDNFKKINNYLGHHVGDFILKEFSMKLKTCLQRDDYIARLGGDEFAIIINLSTLADAEKAAKKIIKNLSTHEFNINDDKIHISCTIGISSNCTSESSAELLIKHAEIAMHYAKELGRNNYQHYSPKIKLKHSDRFFLENALRFAIENNELYMCYQPIFQLNNKKIIGMEALMRWKNPKLGIVPPDIFIPIAEEIGLINSIGAWALQNACEQLSIWYNKGHTKLRLLINISAIQLLNTDLLKTIKQTLKKTKFPATLLEFELTESSAMSSSVIIEHIIQEIAKMKIKISLDDFGTGYSSLSHLRRIPINTLKIDRSFIMDITDNQRDFLIIKSLNSLGKILKLDLIAEGIETDIQLQYLIKNKFKYGQGYYLSRPLTAIDMGILLDKSK